VDPWEVVATFAAAIAALAALGAVWLAWRSLGEARTSGKDLSHTAATVGNLLTQAEQSAKDLQAAGDTLREVLAQERELVSLQGNVIGELRALLGEQRQAAEVDRLHRAIDRLIGVGECVEELGRAVDVARDAGRETSRTASADAALRAALGRLQTAVMATGGEPPVPQSAALAQGHVADLLHRGVNILAQRAEVQAAIHAARAQLRSVSGGSTT
jgi:uncharacterized membrane protein YccC